MRASSKKQFELFGRTVREVRPEHKEFYAAVVYLRSAGCRIIRVSGNQSRLFGALRSNKDVMQIARKMGWEG